MLIAKVICNSLRLLASVPVKYLAPTFFTQLLTQDARCQWGHLPHCDISLQLFLSIFNCTFPPSCILHPSPCQYYLTSIIYSSKSLELCFPFCSTHIFPDFYLLHNHQHNGNKETKKNRLCVSITIDQLLEVCLFVVFNRFMEDQLIVI